MRKEWPVYERAQTTELQIQGIQATTPSPIAVYYKAGILVENTFVLELKCADRLADEHLAQCLNYLKASGHTLCLLVNFQKAKAEWRPVII